MADLPVPRKKQNIVRFPLSPKERQRILWESKDVRVRVCTRLRSAVGWLLVVCALLFALVNYRLFTPTNLQSLMQYAAAGLQRHSGDAATITFENSSFSDAALFGNGLAYADGDTLYIAAPGSSGAPGQQLDFTSPVIEAAGDYILTYERGGTKASLHNALSATGSVTLSSSILTGSLGQSGHFALVTDEQGYRTAVAVYDTSGREVFKWNSSEYYIVSAALSPDGKTLAALAFTQEDVTLTTRLLFYSVSKGEPTASATLDGALGMEVRWLSGDITAVLCDNGLYTCDRRGNAEHVLTAAASDLLAFSFSDESCVLATRSYTGGARGDLYLLRANGRLSGPYAIGDEPSAVGVSDAGAVVLTASGVTLYDNDLTPLWTNSEGVGARRVLLTDDGTAFALYAKNARLFTAHSEQSEDLSHANTGTDDT